MTRIQEQIEDAQRRKDEIETQAAGLRERLQDAPAVEAKLQQVRGEEASARQRLGAAQQRLEACKSLERQRADKLERQKALEVDLSIYDELRTAFGVKGVPAMIIEAAVPEIEAEAHRMLTRMTGGSMTVNFETQQETLAGEVRETLQINISDQVGERPYENYSGGEQFRVTLRSASPSRNCLHGGPGHSSRRWSSTRGLARRTPKVGIGWSRRSTLFRMTSLECSSSRTLAS